MGDNKEKEGQEKGFVVKDKRFSAQKEAPEDSKIKEEAKREKGSEATVSEEDAPLAEITFTNFILSVSTSALIQLGVIQDPATKQLAKYLPLAKQTIDLIGMLKEKTKGNLNPEEENLIENVLYDLRIRYVKALE